MTSKCYVIVPFPLEGDVVGTWLHSPLAFAQADSSTASPAVPLTQLVTESWEQGVYLHAKIGAELKQARTQSRQGTIADMSGCVCLKQVGRCVTASGRQSWGGDAVSGTPAAGLPGACLHPVRGKAAASESTAPDMGEASRLPWCRGSSCLL